MLWDEETLDYVALRRDVERAVARVCPTWIADRRDDLVQAAVMKVMRIAKEQPPSDEGNRAVSTSYLYKVAYSGLVDELRRLRRRRETDLEEDAATLTAGAGDDPSLQGGDGPDSILGGSGNDALFGGDGDDGLDGDAGDDTLSGDDGDDLVFGEGGFDQCFGNNGHDLEVLWDDGPSTCETRISVEGSSTSAEAGSSRHPSGAARRQHVTAAGARRRRGSAQHPHELAAEITFHVGRLSMRLVFQTAAFARLSRTIAGFAQPAARPPGTIAEGIEKPLTLPRGC